MSTLYVTYSTLDLTCNSVAYATPRQPASLRAENSLVEACTALHERWQQHQRQWFNGSLADSEHKLIVTEEARRRSKAAADAAATSSSSSSNVSTDHAYNHRHLR